MLKRIGHDASDAGVGGTIFGVKIIEQVVHRNTYGEINLAVIVDTTDDRLILEGDKHTFIGLPVTWDFANRCGNNVFFANKDPKGSQAWLEKRQATGKDSNSVAADPQFVDSSVCRSRQAFLIK